MDSSLFNILELHFVKVDSLPVTISASGRQRRDRDI